MMERRRKRNNAVEEKDQSLRKIGQLERAPEIQAERAQRDLKDR